MKQDEGIQIYVNVDANGKIVSAMTGEKIVVNQSWDFFFYESKEVADNLQEFKVIIESGKAKLIELEVSV